MEQKERERKPYTPPTVNTHGDAVKQTTGFGGRFWEVLVPRPVQHGDGDLDP
jgi:hypothetical protein